MRWILQAWIPEVGWTMNHWINGTRETFEIIVLKRNFVWEWRSNFVSLFPKVTLMMRPALLSSHNDWFSTKDFLMMRPALLSSHNHWFSTKDFWLLIPWVEKLWTRRQVWPQPFPQHLCPVHSHLHQLYILTQIPILPVSMTQDSNSPCVYDTNSNSPCVYSRTSDVLIVSHSEADETGCHENKSKHLHDFETWK